MTWRSSFLSAVRAHSARKRLFDQATDIFFFSAKRRYLKSTISGLGHQLAPPSTMEPRQDNSKALVRKRCDTELMPPPPRVKKIKRPKQVLDEDKYTDALSSIVARDFFPGIEISAIQNEYLNAVEARDVAWMSSAGRKLQEAMTPDRRRAWSFSQTMQHGAQTPTTSFGETPNSVAPLTLATESTRLGANMSLSKFQATYTSEDNESFYRLIDKQNQKKADKCAWMWSDNKLPSKRMMKQKEVIDRLEKSGRLVDGFKRDTLNIKDSDQRPARPDTWKAAPRNGLMFIPEGLKDVVSIAQNNQDESHMAPMSIVYENTKMPQPHVPQRPPSPTMSAVQDAMASRPRPQYQDSSVIGGDETPRVNGYSFVEDDEDNAASASINLGPGDSHNPFKIQEQRKRESLHERLVERIAKSNKEVSAGKAGRLKASRSTRNCSRAAGNLTPAAQRLLDQIGTPKDRTPSSPFGGLTPHESALVDFNESLANSSMKIADFAIDAAVLLSASRSVAAKHAALRRQQLEAWSKASSLAAAWRQGLGAEGDDGNQRNDAASQASGGESHAASPKNTSAFATSAKQEQDASRPKEDGEAPPGININVFNTARGSKMLDLIKTRTEAKSASQSATKQGAKEHPLRFWPKTSPVQVLDDAVNSKKGSEKGKTLADATMSKDAWRRAPKPGGVGSEETETSKSKRPTLADATMSKDAWRRAPKPGGVAFEDGAPEHHQGENQGQNPTLADASMSQEAVRRAPKPQNNQSADSDGKVRFSTLAQETEETSRVDAETMEAAQALSSSTETSSTPAYQLRESKVPSSRFGRLWNYGGLAAGMLGGAVSESVSRVFGGGGQGSVLLSDGNMERLVTRLSRMRGAALKFGQMMSFQDSKMLPAPLQEVLQRVQDRADYMPAWQRDGVLASNLGSEWRDLFSDFTETPMAAASIGQVHKAVLRSNGRPVAVKIQFPGVAASIDSDIDNLSILLNATSLLPKGLYLEKTLDNARLELGWECDYEREAACARRYKELLMRSTRDRDTFVVPDIYSEASGKQVLTMDLMDGVGVTRVKEYTQAQRDWVGTHIFRLCLEEIAQFRFMQTDPNWTNFLFQQRPAGGHRLALLDFGASREYPDRFVRLYVSLLDAAARADRDAVCALSQDLGYLTGHESRVMRDAHIASIMTLAEPFFADAPSVYDFKGQTITERVKALIPLMLRERLTPPPEETYSLHRKLSGAFLLCARLGSRVPCRDLFVDAVKGSGAAVAPA